jgi:hypothetical protein
MGKIQVQIILNANYENWKWKSMLLQVTLHQFSFKSLNIYGMSWNSSVSKVTGYKLDNI